MPNFVVVGYKIWHNFRLCINNGRVTFEFLPSKGTVCIAVALAWHWQLSRQFCTSYVYFGRDFWAGTDRQ